MRILVIITPRMYREVLALSIHRHCFDFEVLIAPPWPRDGRVGCFELYVLVHDADEAGLPPAVAEGVLCCVWILKTERIDSTIELDGTTSEVSDASLEELLLALEGAESLLSGDGRV